MQDHTSVDGLEYSMELGPASGWLAGIAGVIALIISFRTYRKAQREADKRIGWNITSDAMVMPQSSDARWDQLVVRLGDEELAQPRVVTLEFSNLGEVELKTDDIAIPPTVSITEGAIRAATAEARDHSGGPARALNVVIESQTVAIDRLLLNPGDSITFKLLIDKTQRDVAPTFQAAGFRFVRFYSQGVNRRPYIDDPMREIVYMTRRMASYVGMAAMALVISTVASFFSIFIAFFSVFRF